MRDVGERMNLGGCETNSLFPIPAHDGAVRLERSPDQDARPLTKLDQLDCCVAVSAAINLIGNLLGSRVHVNLA